MIIVYKTGDALVLFWVIMDSELLEFVNFTEKDAPYDWIEIGATMPWLTVKMQHSLTLTKSNLEDKKQNQP